MKRAIDDNFLDCPCCDKAFKKAHIQEHLQGSGKNIALPNSLGPTAQPDGLAPVPAR